ncbi:MAG: class I SAM-dependent methyltransferase [Chloroflexia bacterium]|nr:class I SAM-dependent methyltransferase [Chloroflexia bacterium]
MHQVEPVSSPTERALDRLSSSPRLWNALRWLAEAGFAGERMAIARELRPWHGDTRRFLDLGCGTGEFAREFPPGHYVGVDPSFAYVQFAAHHRPGAYLTGLGEALPFAEASFDAGLVCGVLHHLPDATARAAMSEMARVLRPNAPLLVIEDVPPPGRSNPAGQMLHTLDRGGYIRTTEAYRAIFGPAFRVEQNYPMRTGICDYAVYLLRRGA